MTLQIMRFDRRRWRAVRDLRDVVHHGTLLTKKEAGYLFRLADVVRATVSCSKCGAAEGTWCVRKRDGQAMGNHSCRVTHARYLFEQRVLPRLDRLSQTLCSTTGGMPLLIFGSAIDRDIDCMSCLVTASRQGGG